jgi:hypothetical protein
LSAVHQVEFHRLHLFQDERAGIDTWSIAFDHAWDARLIDQCRRLLAGARSSRPDLTAHSRGVILHSHALMEMTLTHFERAEAETIAVASICYSMLAITRARPGCSTISARSTRRRGG